MIFVIISVVEFIFIIAFCIAIKQDIRERKRLLYEISTLEKDLGYRISAHIEQTIKHASAIRYKVSNELYPKSSKKNLIVQHACIRYYEELLTYLKK